jgi:hypothetical protein
VGSPLPPASRTSPDARSPARMHVPDAPALSALCMCERASRSALWLGLLSAFAWVMVAGRINSIMESFAGSVCAMRLISLGEKENAVLDYSRGCLQRGAVRLLGCQTG